MGRHPMTREAACILVVDDHGPSLMKMSMAVQALGHKVETARNGIEALSAMTRQNFDLLLLDIEMPELAFLRSG